MAAFWQTCEEAAASSLWQTPIGSRVLKAFATV